MLSEKPLGTNLPATSEPEPKSFGRYSVLRHLATGGMGEVYVVHLAGTSTFRRLFVLKTIRSELASDNEFRVMFEQEARIAGMMDHANICHAFEFGYDHGRPYLVMEYLAGFGFGEYMRRLTRTPDLSDVKMTISLLLQACHGLQYAHELADEDGQPAALVHRDVTPSNLMVTKEGVLRVLDFGIARTRARLVETRTGAIKGKYCYMPPEQVQGHAIDRRADVFSIGILLWEAIVGRSLFAHASEYETIRAVVEEVPPRVSIFRPGLAHVAAVIEKALNKSKADRFDSARALGHALVEALRADGLGEPLPGFLLAEELARRLPDLVTSERPGAVQVGPLPVMRDDAVGTTAVDLGGADEGAARTTVSGEFTAVGEIEATPMRTVVTAPARRKISVQRGGAFAAAALVILTGAAVVVAKNRGPAPAPLRLPVAKTLAEQKPPAAPPPVVVATTNTTTAVAEPASPVEAPPPPPMLAPPKSHNRSRKVTPGSFTIEARPYGTVFIDGKRVAVTPLVKHPLPPGRHRIKVIGSNGRSDSFVINVKAGEDAPAKLIMLD